MAELVKPWNDGSGDTFTVIYNADTNVVEILSMPNAGMRRESNVKFNGAEDTFAVKIVQESAISNGNARVCVKEHPTKQHIGVLREDGLDIRCIVFLDKNGTPCSIKFKEIGDE